MGNIGENIKNFRTFRGIKQQELADMLDRTKSVISNWERGINSPEVDLVETMCKIFQCSPNEIFGWEESQELAVLEEFKNLQKEKNDIEKRIVEYAKRLNDYKKNND